MKSKMNHNHHSNNDYFLKNLRHICRNLSNFSLVFKLILAKSLIDKGILKKSKIHHYYGESFEELIKNKNHLFKFLNYLSLRFGGDIFKITPDDYNIADEELNNLYNLFKGNNLDYHQSLLVEFYDFSKISHEFIANVYEILNSEKSSGIYNTPVKLVNHMLNDNAGYKFKLHCDLRILDPSCGSGIFLIESFKRLIGSDSDDVRICEILKKSIFGVDSDGDAVDITILSIYITLIDYIRDFDNFKFPYLKDRNIFNRDFFDDDINDLGLFDIVVGNPPWYHARGGEKSFEKYAKKHLIPISNRQIADAYPSRVCDFLKKDGIASLVLTGKIFYNLRDYKFRQYLLNNFNIIEIFDLTLIKRSLFKNTSWPSVILTFSNATPSDTVKHISVKPDYAVVLKEVRRCDLLDYDWLFKTLLVGNEDDFKLILRLKKENITLEEFISNHPRLKTGVGFKKSLNKNDADISQFLNLPYVKNADIKRYEISTNSKWKYPYAGSGDAGLISPPFVLVKSTFTKSFDFIAAFCDEGIVFDHNTFAIKGEFSDIVVLKNIMALINSDLFRYFFYMSGNVGVEKNRSPFRERMKFPLSRNIIDNHELYDLVCLRERCFEKCGEYDMKINEVIFKAYGLSDGEIDLIYLYDEFKK